MSSRTADARRKLEIGGHLELSVDERMVDLTAEGSRLHAAVTVAVDRSSLRAVGVNRRRVRPLWHALDALTLTLVVTREGKPLAELGSGVRGGPLARLFGSSRIRLFKRS